MESLVLVHIAFCLLSGQIPSEFGNFVAMQKLQPTVDDLYNDFPPIFIKQLKEAWTGSIPSELRQLHEIQLLLLYQNQLEGAIPSQLGRLGNLTLMRAAKNSLTGTLPTELGLMSNLAQLALWSNGFSGTIPNELGILANESSSFRFLDVWRTNLTGSIPQGLCLLEQYEHEAGSGLFFECSTTLCGCSCVCEDSNATLEL